MPDNLADRIKRRASVMEGVQSAVKNEIRSALEGLPHIDRISVRTKFDISLIKKAESGRYKDPLIEIEDQIGARVIVHFLSDIDIVKDRILRYFSRAERRFVRPERADSFAYESEHLILMLGRNLIPDHSIPTVDIPTTFELQIRTILMHAFAEPQHDMVYKRETPLSFEMQRRNAWIAASCWGADRELEEIRKWCSDNPA